MRSLFFIILFILLFSSKALPRTDLPLHLLKLPKGFVIDIYAYPVEGAREMTLGEKGTVFVGSIQAGKVYAITQDTKKQRQKIIILASNLTMPNGVAFHDHSLYVATTTQILRFDKIESNLLKPLKPVIIYNQLPNYSHHGWRYIKFGPDKKLYIGIGAPCNVCLNNDPILASIIRMNKDGSHLEIFAKGVRNTIGFDWDSSKMLWFTDNGRDWLGDDVPKEELNYAPRANLHFGFPFCHGKNTPDPDFGKTMDCKDFVSPVFEMPAHSAPLDMLFYTGKMFPKKYQGQIFIAQHGSWNRSAKVGYEVITVDPQHHTSMTAAPFITGWLQKEKAWGRPVAFLALPDGSLLISDDHANVIYRVSYRKDQ